MDIRVSLQSSCQKCLQINHDDDEDEDNDDGQLLAPLQIKQLGHKHWRPSLEAPALLVMNPP